MKNKYEIFIPGPLPGENEMIAAAKQKLRSKGKRKNFGTVYDIMKKKYTQHCANVFKNSDLPTLTYIKVGFLWLEKNRRRDKDNICAAKKFILDGLVSSGLLKNDGWKNIDSFTGDKFDVDKENPGVIVSIEEVL